MLLDARKRLLEHVVIPDAAVDDDPLELLWLDAPAGKHLSKRLLVLVPVVLPVRPYPADRLLEMPRDRLRGDEQLISGAMQSVREDGFLPMPDWRKFHREPPCFQAGVHTIEERRVEMLHAEHRPVLMPEEPLDVHAAVDLVKSALQERRLLPGRSRMKHDPADGSDKAFVPTAAVHVGFRERP